MPSARPRRSGPAAATTMAMPFDARRAEAIPCSTRKAMSAGKFGARPQNAELRTNIGKVGGAPEEVRDIWSVGHQTSRFDELSKVVLTLSRAADREV